MNKMVIALFFFSAAAKSTTVALTQSEKLWIAAHPTIRYAIDPKWKPIEYADNGVPTGLTVAYLKRAADLVGLKLSYVRTTSWEDSVFRFSKGDVELLPGIPDFELPQPLVEGANLTPPYFVSSTIVVTGAKNRIINDFKDFSRDDVVAMRGGGAYEIWVKKQFPYIRARFYKSTSDALDAVVSGHATAAIGPEPILHPVIRQKYKNLLYVAGVVQELPLVLRIATHKSSPELKAIFRKALSAIDAEDADAIQEAWTEDADYGRPSTRALIRYFGFRIGLFFITMILMLLALFQLRRLHIAASKLAQQRAMFLATMTHEIRNPMNYILSSIELARIHAKDEKSKYYIDVAIKGGESLLDIADSVLDYWRSDGRRRENKIGRISELLNTVVPGMRILANQKGVGFEVFASDIVDAPLIIDETAIRQVLINIISNAIKFTDQGLVSLSIESEGECAEECIRFSVVDTGVGIPRKDIRKVLRPFFQVRAESEANSNSGIGLGLSICKALAEKMGGNLSVKSIVGKGTTVSMIVPIRRATHNDSQVKKELPKFSFIHGGRVLVVEDVPANQRILRDQLEYLGLEVTVVGSGRDAMDAVKENRFDLVFLDYRLPDMMGVDVSRYIRDVASLGGAAISIIGMSADANPEVVNSCASGGMNDVIQKPIGICRLVEIVKGCFSLSEIDDLAGFGGGIGGVAEFEIKRSIREEIVCAARNAGNGRCDQADFHVHRLRGIALSFNFDWIVKFVDCNLSSDVDLFERRRRLLKFMGELRRRGFFEEVAR